MANARTENKILEFRLNTTSNFNIELMEKVKVLDSKNDELKVKKDKIAELEKELEPKKVLKYKCLIRRKKQFKKVKILS